MFYKGTASSYVFEQNIFFMHSLHSSSHSYYSCLSLVHMCAHHTHTVTHTHHHSLSLSLTHTHHHSLSLSLTHTHTTTLSPTHTHTHTFTDTMQKSLIRLCERKGIDMRKAKHRPPYLLTADPETAQPAKRRWRGGKTSLYSSFVHVLVHLWVLVCDSVWFLLIATVTEAYSLCHCSSSTDINGPCLSWFYQVLPFSEVEM